MCDRRTTNEELPSRQEYDTVCLFADVSGFTALSEAMMSSAEGVEGLAKHLNSYFGQMVRIIASEGGDVFKVRVLLQEHSRHGYRVRVIRTNSFHARRINTMLSWAVVGLAMLETLSLLRGSFNVITVCARVHLSLIHVNLRNDSCFFLCFFLCLFVFIRVFRRVSSCLFVCLFVFRRVFARCLIIKFAGDALIVLWPPPAREALTDITTKGREKESGVEVHTLRDFCRACVCLAYRVYTNRF